MATSIQDKIEEEVQSLEFELDALKGAKKTSEACKLLAGYVTDKEGSDPLVAHTSENPFLSAPATGQGCCTVS